MRGASLRQLQGVKGEGGEKKITGGKGRWREGNIWFDQSAFPINLHEKEKTGEPKKSLGGERGSEDWFQASAAIVHK